jgi:hypothetical protein
MNTRSIVSAERRAKRSVAMRAAGLVTFLILIGGVASLVSAASTLDEIERGIATVNGAEIAKRSDAPARADAVEALAAGGVDQGDAYVLGVRLGGVLLELDSDATAWRPGDRAAVEREVRALLAQQKRVGVGDRALCLSAGHSDPSSFENLMRLAEPSWSCGHRHGQTLN